MSAASLNLLKGGKKTAMEEELKKPEPAPEPAPEQEVDYVDVDLMSSDEIDELVVENGVQLPDWWATVEVDKKRAWLKEQFEEAPEEADPVAALQVEEKEKPAKTKAAEEIVEAGLVQIGTEDPVKLVDPVVAPPKKPKKASKSKAVATSNVKEGEIVEDDDLADMVHEIENTSVEQAMVEIPKLIDQTDMAFFKLGGYLSVVQLNEGYKPDYATFRDFVEQKYGMEYRKATYCTAIYNSLTEAKVPWAKVKGVGWTKLKEIAPILTPDNVDEWVEKAKNLNTISLIDAVKKAKEQGANAIEDQSETKTKKSLTFKAFPDQEEVIKTAIHKAKQSSGTDVDTVALEYICADFIGGQTMTQRLQKMGIEAALDALEKAYPKASIKVTIDDTDTAAAA